MKAGSGYETVHDSKVSYLQYIQSISIHFISIGKVQSMQKYLIYQDESKKLYKKPIFDEKKARAIVDSKKKIKLDGQLIHIVGIGTQEDFIVHCNMVGQTTDMPAYEKLKKATLEYKQTGIWPRD